MDDDLPENQRSLPEVRIVILYVVFASLWILGSDFFLSERLHVEAELGWMQTFKGLNFVLATGILLYCVLRKAFGGWRLAEERRLTVVRQARERYRRLSAHVESLREEERKRIAREIHDELGQSLTGLKMELRLMENQLADRDDRSCNPIIDKLVEMTELVDTTILSVQRISAGLRPSALDHIGLAAALAEEADQFTLRTGVPCTIEINDPAVALSDEVETVIFRIFQESLTNVARHADAGRVDAVFSVNDDALKLSIWDDGRGFDVDSLDDPKSLGLIGMLERASNIGGKLIIKRGIQSGTEVVLNLPVGDASAERISFR